MVLGSVWVRCSLTGVRSHENKAALTIAVDIRDTEHKTRLFTEHQWLMC